MKSKVKMCRSYTTCPDHTCGSCNSNPYNSACGATTLDGAGNPLSNAKKDPLACEYWPTCKQHPACFECSSGRKNTALTPEVLPPETNALTNSRTNELATTSHSPSEVVAQYRLAVAGTLEMLRFGAMLVEVDSDLNRGNPKGFIKTGDSLQAWLETNCPQVNYKTAMRFKRLAEGLQREFKIPAKMRLTDALPTSDGSTTESTGVIEVNRERVIEMREEIWEFVNGKSARQLMFDFGLTAERKPTGGSREGSGRPTKSVEEKLDLDGEISRKIILGHVDPLREEIMSRRGWMRISDDKLETLRTLLKEVVSKMSDELERRGRANKFNRR